MTSPSSRPSLKTVLIASGVVLTLDKFGNRGRLSAGQSQSMTALDYLERVRAMPNRRTTGGPDSDGGGDGSGGGAGSGGGGDAGDDGGGDD